MKEQMAWIRRLKYNECVCIYRGISMDMDIGTDIAIDH